MTNSIAQKFNVFTLLKFAFPTMVMMVFMSLYTIVDGIFVSRFVGSNALSAVNIVYPVLNLLFACGIMLSTGGSAIVARQIGEKREQEARENFSFLAAVSVLIGIVILALGLLFLEPLCRVLGATPVIMEDCKIYLGVLLGFGPLTMLQMFFQVFFVTAGKPGLGLVLTISGGVANMVLDYVLMGPMEMGVLGAALATGFGQAIMAVAGVGYFFWVKGSLHFVKPVFRGQILLQSCGNGSSEMVSNLSTAVVTFLFNITMLNLVGEDGVAAITIVLYGQFLFTSLYLGFSMGVGPVFSFNYGNKNHEQLKRIYKICKWFILLSSIVILGIALVFSEPIVGIFTGEENHTYELAVEGFFLFSFNYLFAGINIFASALFTALSNGKISAIISFCRTFVFIVASIVLLPMIMGITGVWLAVPLAELITLFISAWYLKGQKKVYHYG